MSNEGEKVAERLMGALISKMENMDVGLQMLKAENQELRRIMNDPTNLLKKAGFIRASTQRPHDISDDQFRGDVSDTILKGIDREGIASPQTNADFHNMEWDDIHTLAEQAKSSGALGNQLGME